ncbi:hypothetical protein HYFRA_00000828 [Hymenoscyphus fraxineus]|uniref:Uncharacterized protein n=1 Tax=Hymenoscyphus fraxineus TaxID=746836 RepID=A0A9N9KQ94_9HELO|nr:hypothetical protein HYFRA_00000828 [Hymenoscyphus fraxineus]
MIFNLILVATLLSSVSASPVAAPATGLPDDGVYWKVTEYFAECTRGGDGDYRYKVEGDKFGASVPAFVGECNGTYIKALQDAGQEGVFEACKIADQGSSSRKFFTRILSKGVSSNTLKVQGRLQFQEEDSKKVFNFTSAGLEIQFGVSDLITFNIDNIDNGVEVKP